MATIPPGGGDFVWAIRAPGISGGSGGPSGGPSGGLYMTGHAAERKGAEDLTSSIMASKGRSRYLEQKYYIQRCGLKRLMYVIEGDTDRRQVVGNTVNTALMALSADASSLAQGFVVWRTDDLAGTGRLLRSITEALQ